MKPPVRPRDPFTAARPRPAESVPAHATTPEDARRGRAAAIREVAQRKATAAAAPQATPAEAMAMIDQGEATTEQALDGLGLPAPADPPAAPAAPAAPPNQARPRDIRVAAQLRALAEALNALAAALEAP